MLGEENTWKPTTLRISIAGENDMVFGFKALYSVMYDGASKKLFTYSGECVRVYYIAYGLW